MKLFAFAIFLGQGPNLFISVVKTHLQLLAIRALTGIALRGATFSVFVDWGFVSCAQAIARVGFSWGVHVIWGRDGARDRRVRRERVRVEDAARRRVAFGIIVGIFVFSGRGKSQKKRDYGWE